MTRAPRDLGRMTFALFGALLMQRNAAGEGQVPGAAGAGGDGIQAIAGDGTFDGDIRVCFNKGSVSVESLPSWPKGGLFRMKLEITTDGGTKTQEINGMGNHPVSGDWSRVTSTGAPVMNNWSRVSSGNAPDFRTVSETCSDWIDGDGGRPGAVNFKVFWPIVADSLSSAVAARQAPPSGLPEKARVAITFDDTVRAESKTGTVGDAIVSTVVGVRSKAWDAEVVKFPSLKALTKKMTDMK